MFSKRESDGLFAFGERKIEREREREREMRC